MKIPSMALRNRVRGERARRARFGWPLLLAALVLPPAPARASGASGLPRVVLGDGLVVETDLKAAPAAELVRILKSYRSWALHALRASTGVVAAPDVRVVLFGRQRSYLETTAEFAASLASNGGFYDGADQTIYSFREGNALSLLFHEYAHAFIGTHFGDATFSRYRRRGWPVWLDEGLAEVLAAVELRRSPAGYEVRSASAIKLGLLLDDGGRVRFPLGLDRLLSAPMSAYRGQSLDAYYAMAHALTYVLMERPEELRRALRDLRDRRDPRVVVRRLVAAQGGIAALERRIRRVVVERVRAAWQKPWVLAGVEDSTWNWIPVGGGHVALDRGLRFDPVPGSEPGPLLVRQIPPIRDLRVRTRLDVRHGTVELLFSTAVERIDRPTLRLRFSRKHARITLAAKGRPGVPLKVRLPRGARPSALDVEVRFDAGGISIRAAGQELAGTSPAGGLLRSVGVARVSGTATVGAIQILPLQAVYPAGPSPRGTTPAHRPAGAR